MSFEKAQKKRHIHRATAAPSACASFLHTSEVAAVAGEHMTDKELCRLGAAGKTTFVYILDIRFETRIWRAVVVRDDVVHRYAKYRYEKVVSTLVAIFKGTAPWIVPCCERCRGQEDQGRLVRRLTLAALGKI